MFFVEEHTAVPVNFFGCSQQTQNIDLSVWISASGTRRILLV